MNSVMQAIRKRKGLCGEIARRAKLSGRQVVRGWRRVPLKHVKIVSEVTGLPEKVLRAEHEKDWRIPLKDVIG